MARTGLFVEVHNWLDVTSESNAPVKLHDNGTKDVYLSWHTATGVHAGRVDRDVLAKLLWPGDSDNG